VGESTYRLLSLADRGTWRDPAEMPILFGILQKDPPTTFEEKKLSAPAADQALVKALRGKRGQLTKADAVAASGLPTHLVDESLDRLLKEYRSHLAVTEEGELLYSFEPGMVRRGEPTFAERVRAAGRWLARAGMWVFKVWITVTLVAYVVAFLVLLLGAMFGGSDRDRRSSRHGDGGLGWLIWMFTPNWGYGYGYHRDPWGRPIPGPEQRRRIGGRPRKKILQSVYDFVFGPALPAPDKLADEREALAYIRENDGRITATDLVALHGWSYRRAEEEATRLLVDYDGEPEVTEDGVLVYAFPALLKSTDSDASRDWKPTWQKPEKNPKLTDNSPTANWVIGAFAGFNLLVSFFAAGWARAQYGLSGAVWTFFFTVFPLIFFTLFLSVPGLRALAARVGNRRRALRNKRRESIRRILAADGGPLPMTDDLSALALPLEGEPDTTEAGDPVITFARVREEKAAVKRHIAGLDLSKERSLGPVIFGDRILPSKDSD
jgi:hypothetical protein